jgi:uncharacterized protein (DUF3084 family)
MLLLQAQLEDTIADLRATLEDTADGAAETEAALEELMEEQEGELNKAKADLATVTVAKTAAEEALAAASAELTRASELNRGRCEQHTRLLWTK